MTHLEVCVLQAAHHNSVHAVLRDIEGLVFSEVLVVKEATEDDVVESTLIL